MSFDSVFDFTNNKTQANQTITTYNQLITDATAENAYLETLTNYLQLTENKRSSNSGDIINYTREITKLTNMLTLIQGVETLGSSQKNDLYSFYLELEVDKNTFASRILANYNSILTDISPILADQTLSADGRYLLLCIVYDKYISSIELLVSI